MPALRGAARVGDTVGTWLWTGESVECGRQVLSALGCELALEPGRTVCSATKVQAASLFAIAQVAKGAVLVQRVDEVAGVAGEQVRVVLAGDAD